MIRLITFFSVLFISIVNLLCCELQNSLPSEFIVKKHRFSLSSDFDIEAKNQKLGSIHRKIFSFSTIYKFYDAYNQLKAKAKARWFAWGAIFDVYDDMNKILGIIEERSHPFFPTFEILSLRGEKLAIAQMNFWGTRYTLKDPITGLTMVTMKCPFFSYDLDWNITIENLDLFNQKQIDAYLFLLTLAICTDKKKANEESRSFQCRGDLLESHSPINDSMIRSKYSLEDISELKEQLARNQTLFITLVPSKVDFDEAERMVDSLLNSFQSSENGETGKSDLILAMQFLFPLFESNDLTDGQKSALYQLIEYKLMH